MFKIKKLWRGYGTLKRLHRGVRAYAYLTFRCNQACRYCGNNLLIAESLHSRTAFKFDEINPQEWFHLITHFPAKIREIVLTGGEPFMHKGCADLTNYLTSSGFFVTLFSNLALFPEGKINPSIRLHIIGTLHLNQNAEEFWKKYNRIKKDYRVSIDVMSQTTNDLDEKRLGFRNIRRKHVQTKEEMLADECWYEPRFHFLPDGTIHISEENAIRDAVRRFVSRG